MKAKKTLSSLLILLTILTITSGFRRAVKWEHLGTRTVNMTADHDEIVVTASEGKFSSLKFYVSRAPLHIINCKVIFANNEEATLDLKHDFAAGSESRIIDLPGERRVIRKIIFNYSSSSPTNKKAVVTVYGMR